MESQKTWAAFILTYYCVLVISHFNPAFGFTVSADGVDQFHLGTTANLDPSDTTGNTSSASLDTVFNSSADSSFKSGFEKLAVVADDSNGTDTSTAVSSAGNGTDTPTVVSSVGTTSYSSHIANSAKSTDTNPTTAGASTAISETGNGTDTSTAVSSAGNGTNISTAVSSAGNGTNTSTAVSSAGNGTNTSTAVSSAGTTSYTRSTQATNSTNSMDTIPTTAGTTKRTTDKTTAVRATIRHRPDSAEQYLLVALGGFIFAMIAALLIHIARIYCGKTAKEFKEMVKSKSTESRNENDQAMTTTT